MSALITLAIIGTYLSFAARHVMPFAKDYAREQVQAYPSLYADKSAYFREETKQLRSDLNREAVWIGVGKALFWPWVLICRAITSRLVNSLTAEERKAEELKEARRVIAEYEAEQAAKNGLVPWKF